MFVGVWDEEVTLTPEGWVQSGSDLGGWEEEVVAVSKCRKEFGLDEFG